MIRLSHSEFLALARKTRQKAQERAERRKTKGEALGLRKRCIRKRSARRAAFARLASLCKEFVMGRCHARNGGFCEIAMACGGRAYADTWYHGWPQKGGNGLKYDHRSHFASCKACNMGEYGARMRGSKIYEDRHKALLGPLWPVLNALHGRRQISTAEALTMGDALEGKIKARDWK